jgi:hypothetical protein
MHDSGVGIAPREGEGVCHCLPSPGGEGSTHMSEANVRRGGVRDKFTPPRLLIAFAIDPPPPGEGESLTKLNCFVAFAPRFDAGLIVGGHQWRQVQST